MVDGQFIMDFLLKMEEWSPKSVLNTKLKQREFIALNLVIVQQLQE
jgi:hypothetical protein